MEKLKLLKNNIANIISLTIIPISLVSFYFTYNHRIFLSFLFISLCFLLDTIDGYVARKIEAESEVGKTIDSFCDFIIYLIFPVFLIFQYLNFNLLITLLICSIILISGIIKLARFNNEGFVIIKNQKYYRGLMVPFVLLSTIVSYIIHIKYFPNIIYFFPLIMIVISVLMISNIKIKKINNFIWYFIVILILWMTY